MTQELPLPPPTVGSILRRTASAVIPAFSYGSQRHSLSSHSLALHFHLTSSPFLSLDALVACLPARLQNAMLPAAGFAIFPSLPIVSFPSAAALSRPYYSSTITIFSLSIINSRCYTLGPPFSLTSNKNGI